MTRSKDVVAQGVMTGAKGRPRGGLWRMASGLVGLLSLGVVAASGGGPASSAPPPSPSSLHPVSSPGCHGSAAAVPGESTHSLSSAGTSGTYIQDVPDAGAGGGPTAVVFDLHGYLEPASLEQTGTGLGPYGGQPWFRDDHAAAQ